MDSTLLPFALLCFTSFFTLTNPLGTMPVFLTMTHGMTDKERQSIVRRKYHHYCADQTYQQELLSDPCHLSAEVSWH